MDRKNPMTSKFFFNGRITRAGRKFIALCARAVPLARASARRSALTNVTASWHQHRGNIRIYGICGLWEFEIYELMKSIIRANGVIAWP